MEETVQNFETYTMKSMMEYLDWLERMLMELDSRRCSGNLLFTELECYSWTELVDAASLTNELLGKLIKSIR